jgi:hypothetical protein
MFSPVQVLVGLGIFFSLLWLPLLVGFLTGRMRDNREPLSDGGRAYRDKDSG